VNWAVLRFTPERARWVAAEKWHPHQKGQLLKDGFYELRVPYADDREIIMDILKYGEDCQVLGPDALIDRVRDQFRLALGQY
jgi:predicted DNA-binding transcriptional regulator YafY